MISKLRRPTWKVLRRGSEPARMVWKPALRSSPPRVFSSSENRTPVFDQSDSKSETLQGKYGLKNRKTLNFRAALMILRALHNNFVHYVPSKHIFWTENMILSSKVLRKAPKTVCEFGNFAKFLWHISSSDPVRYEKIWQRKSHHKERNCGQKNRFSMETIFWPPSIDFRLFSALKSTDLPNLKISKAEMVKIFTFRKIWFFSPQFFHF